MSFRDPVSKAVSQSALFKYTTPVIVTTQGVSYGEGEEKGRPEKDA